MIATLTYLILVCTGICEEPQRVIGVYLTYEECLKAVKQPGAPYHEWCVPAKAAGGAEQ